MKIFKSKWTLGIFTVVVLSAIFLTLGFDFGERAWQVVYWGDDKPGILGALNTGNGHAIGAQARGSGAAVHTVNRSGLGRALWCEGPSYFEGNIGLWTEPKFGWGSGRGIHICGDGALEEGAVIRLTEGGSMFGDFEIRSVRDWVINKLKIGEGSDTFLTMIGEAENRGNVGIGTIDPSELFHVYADYRTVVSRFESGDSVTAIDLADIDGYTRIQTVGNNFEIRSGGQTGDAAIRVNENGDVGFGIPPAYPLHMEGGAYCTGTDWIPACSKEYKKNIRDLSLDEAVTTLEQLQPKKYYYKTDNTDEHLGFIAEDVPELVATKDRKGLSPLEIVAVLTKVVQQQQKKIEALEAQLYK